MRKFLEALDWNQSMQAWAARRKTGRWRMKMGVPADGRLDFWVFHQKDNEHGDHQTRRSRVRKGICELTGTKCAHKKTTDTGQQDDKTS
jgi:hypothetical protein